jgi:hypothetical protein
MVSFPFIKNRFSIFLEWKESSFIGEFEFDLLSGSIDLIEHHDSVFFLVVLQIGISQVIGEEVGENGVALLAAIKVDLGGLYGFILVGQRACEFENGKRHLVI